MAPPASHPPRLLRLAVNALSACFGRRVPGGAVTPLRIGAMPARLYLPPNPRPGPPIVFLHGGGFVSCSLETHDGLCRRLALTSGLRVIAPAYRLAPEHPAPAQLEDALAACRWVLGNPAELGAPASQFILSGDSAGGYLAVRCAMALNQHAPSVAAQVLFYPLITLDAERETRPSPPGPIEQTILGFMRTQLGPASYPSLLSLDLTNLPRTTLISGQSLDPVYPTNQAFAAALKSAAIPVEHHKFPHLFHGALNLDHLSRSARLAVETGGKFLK